jgi:polysaccharide pyruvyl transferase WcaK-like protein
MILQSQNKNEERVNRHNPGSVKKIGLMGPYGGNLGDAAIQQAMIQNIQNYYPNAKIYGFSLDPNDTENRHHIPSFPITRFYCREQWWLGKNPNFFTTRLYKLVERLSSVSNPIVRKFGNLLIYPILEIIATVNAYKNLDGFDVLLVSGGGQIDDYWGGPWAHPYTLLFWGILAKLRKTKYAIVSVGAGPLDAKLSRLFIKWVLSLACYRSYRDEDSKKFIEKTVGFKRSDRVYPDLAHSLRLTDYQKSSTGQKLRPVVGVNPIPYFDPRIWPQKDRAAYSRYVNELASFVTWLIEQQYAILFFSGCPAGDPPVIQDIKEILDKNRIVYSQDQIIDSPTSTVDNLMTQLAMTDMVVACRFHGVLLSILINKPVLTLSYHPKINMLMADTEQSHYCLPIDDFNLDTCKERFLALEANQESIKQQLAKRTQEYRSALDEQYERLFQNL